MNVLVTGASGFIGSRLTKIKKKGIKFIHIDHSMGEDFMDEDLLADCLAGSDAVIHLAAVSNGPAAAADPVRAFQTNVAGTALVAKLCDEFSVPMIYASSAGVYGDSIYGLTKRQGEEAAQCFMKENLLVARIFNVYDETYDQKGVIGKFLTEAENSNTVTIYGGGNQVRDFVHAEDLCRFFIHALKNWNPQAGVVEFGTGKGTSIRKVAKFIAKRTGSDVVNDSSQSVGIDISIANTRDLKEKFDFKFKNGLFETIAEELG